MSSRGRGLSLLVMIGILITAWSILHFTNGGDSKVGLSDKHTLVEDPKVHLAQHDGIYVAYENGFPIPSFDTWRLDGANREYLPLNGDWKFVHAEVLECPEMDSSPTCTGNDYDDSTWSEQQVPASLDLAYEKGAYQYKFGSFWFRKSFDVKGDWSSKFVKLNALGMGYQSVLYMNGVKIGEHEGSTTPFSINVTSYLQYGKSNVIAIEIKRRTHADQDNGALPAGGFDWWDYSGIVRDLYLEATSPQTVSKIIAAASPIEKKVRANVVILNYGSNQQELKVKVSSGVPNVAEQTQTAVIEANGVKVLNYEFDTPELQPWTTQTPQLYKLKAEILGADQLIAQYGAVDVEVARASVLVNGSPEWFKGVNWHDENRESGRSMSPEEYRQEMDAAKNAQANLLRNAHYNRHPYAYEYADQIGIYMMDEIENYWLSESAIGHQLYEKGLSREKAIAMAWNQINHPSVIIWSVANENTPNNNTHLKWFNDMRDAVRKVDPKKRPVTYASNTQHHPVDLSMSAADIIGLNQYYGFHGGDSEDYGAAEYRNKLLDINKRYPDKPIILTENGTWSNLGDRSREQWQAANFAAHWDVTVTYPFTAGYTFWNLKDYRSKMEYTVKDFQRLSTMGMVAWADRAPKIVYYYYQEATSRGANRILNPRFARGTAEWELSGLTAQQQAASPGQEGLAISLDKGKAVTLRQRAFQLLAGKYVLELQVSGLDGEQAAGTLGVYSVKGGQLNETRSMDSSGMVQVPFELTHKGVTDIMVSLQLEGKADGQQVSLQQVNLFPILQ